MLPPSHRLWVYIVSPSLLLIIAQSLTASETVSSDQDLPSDSVENHATAEGTNEKSDETEPSNEWSAENDETEPPEGEDIAEQDVPTGP